MVPQVLSVAVIVGGGGELCKKILLPKPHAGLIDSALVPAKVEPQSFLRTYLATTSLQPTVNQSVGKTKSDRKGPAGSQMPFQLN